VAQRRDRLGERLPEAVRLGSFEVTLLDSKRERRDRRLLDQVKETDRDRFEQPDRSDLRRVAGEPGGQ
jgi:hypothetical protein